MNSTVSYPRQTLFHGAAWYPEQSNEAQIEQDVRLMKEAGLNVVRLGEFAWSRLEPSKGELKIEWLQKALDLLHAHGIGAILGTPTAAPPQWLTAEYPEICFQEDDGYRHRHGGRQHACYNHEVFRAHSRRIAETVASAFGNHPALLGWQIDNEFRGHQKICICRACGKRWARWLEERYGSISALNEAWGCEVWSNRYVSFELVPQPYRLCTWAHHNSLLLNYRRFMNDSVLDYMREQVQVIRKHSTHPVTHNSENSIDEHDLAQNLDFMSADIYICYCSPIHARFRLDSMRSVKKDTPFWTMETGSDGTLFSEMQPPGWLACYAFQNYTSGAQGFSYWPWRQLRGGTEIDHLAVLYQCGRPTPAWEEVLKVEQLRLRLEPLLQEFRPAPAEVALLRSEANGRYFFTDRIGGLEPNFCYNANIIEFYSSLVSAGVWRDVVMDEAELSVYKVIFTPYLPHASDGLLQKLRRHVENGGTWIIGPYCGYRERDGTVPENAILGKLERMVGFSTRYFTPEGKVPVSILRGITGHSAMYATAFEPQAEDEVLGYYTGARMKGLAWGISRDLGRGRVYVLGSELDPGARTALIGQLLDREQISRQPLPDRLWMCPQITRSGKNAWAISNWDEVSHQLAMPTGGTDLLTGCRVGPKLVLQPFRNAFVEFDSP